MTALAFAALLRRHGVVCRARRVPVEGDWMLADSLWLALRRHVAVRVLGA